MARRSVRSYNSPALTELTQIPYLLNGEIFKIISRDGNNVAVECRYCSKICKGNIKSTGNFHVHIKRKHPSLLQKIQELKTKSSSDKKSKTLNINTKRTLRRNKKSSSMVNCTSTITTSSESANLRSNLIETNNNDNIDAVGSGCTIRRQDQDRPNEDHNNDGPLNGQNLNDEIFSTTSLVSRFENAQRVFNTRAILQALLLSPSTTSLPLDASVPIPTTSDENSQQNPVSGDVNGIISSVFSLARQNYGYLLNNVSAVTNFLQFTSEIMNNNNLNNYDNYSIHNYSFLRMNMILSQLSQLDNSLQRIERELHFNNQLQYQNQILQFMRLRENFRVQN